jgi:hypothetical protein
MTLLSAMAEIRDQVAVGKPVVLSCLIFARTPPAQWISRPILAAFRC